MFEAVATEVRQHIFERVADALADDRFVRIQRHIGMWPHVELAPLPKREHITIVAEAGACNARVWIGPHELFLSVFLYLGELRVGFKMPRALCEQVLDFDSVYAGATLSRSTQGADWYFQDWIFRDGFATSEAMLMTRDPVVLDWVADACARVITHLYLSVTFLLAGGEARQSAASRGAAQEFMLELAAESGELDQLRDRMSAAGVRWVSVNRQAEGRYLVLAFSEQDQAQVQHQIARLTHGAARMIGFVDAA